MLLFFFFFQAEDGIRYLTVTGVQTCALPIFAGERLPQARRRRHGQQLRALQLADQVRDDLEVELAVAQHVRRRDVLQRRLAVHLLPQELLVVGQEQEAVGRRVLEDEGALAVHLRGDLGQLERARGHARGPRLDEGNAAADLADFEPVALLGSDEQLQARASRRRGGALAHRDSTSSPVASRPQRVTSATRSPEARRRSMKMRTSDSKKAAAARGLTSVSLASAARSSTRSTASLSAEMVAERGERSKSAISPKKSPGPTRASTCSTRPVTALEMTSEPARTRNISSPASPSRSRTWPRLSARSRRLSARIPSSGPSILRNRRRSEERRVGKECRSRWSPYH